MVTSHLLNQCERFVLHRRTARGTYNLQYIEHDALEVVLGMRHLGTARRGYLISLVSLRKIQKDEVQPNCRQRMLKYH